MGRRSRQARYALRDHGNGWFTETERLGASHTYVAYQLDTDGYQVVGTGRRFGYARDALAYVGGRKHEPQPVASPRDPSAVAERIRQLLDKLP